MRTAVFVVLGLGSAAVARDLVTIDFDLAPSTMPQSFYSAQGVTIGLTSGQPGPSGGGEVSIVSAPGGLPAPASGKGITPYANLAGYMGSFEMIFSNPIDYFSLHAFDGPQAFTVQAFRFGSAVSTLNVPAEPGRLAIELAFGSPGSTTRIDRVVVFPVAGIGGSDPNRGPKYYDRLAYSFVPAPASLGALLGVFAFRRRR
jgi:hypothetical protein